jgi:hypothetical protein
VNTLDALFVGLIVLYAVVAAKVDQWITIAALGFRLETPQGFLEHPRAYDLIRSALFLSAAATLCGANVIVGIWVSSFSQVHGLGPVGWGRSELSRRTAKCGAKESKMQKHLKTGLSVKQKQRRPMKNCENESRALGSGEPNGTFQRIAFGAR